MYPESMQRVGRLILARLGRGPAAPAVLDDDSAAWVHRNRLEPLFYVWNIAAERWRAEYLRNVSRAEAALRIGVDMVNRLEKDSIPCLPLRGPFWGMQYWGDPAVRTFSDLDLFVPSALAGKALKCLEQAGFRLRPRGMPAPYYRAIHLHYPLVHPGQGVYCDLHWAVDHPFRADRIPYETIFAASEIKSFGPYRWRIAAVVHERMLTALHYAKEFPSATGRSDSLVWSEAMYSGQFKPVLDLAVCGFPIEAGAEFDALSQLARDWRVDASLRRAREALGGFYDLQMSEGGGLDRQTASPDRPEFMLGFRRRRLAEIRSYLTGESGWRAGAHVLGAGCLAALCLATWKIRSIITRGAS